MTGAAFFVSLSSEAKSISNFLAFGFSTWQYTQPDVQGEREAAHGGLQLFAGDVHRENLQIRELLKELCRGGHSAEHDSKQRIAT
jgi:hypothetical protein